MVQIPKTYDQIEREESDDIVRDELTVNGKDIRLYKSDECYIPSMSTLKKFSDDGGDYSSWENRNDGKNGKPHYVDLKNLLALRGTLIHAETLSNFTKRDIHGDEEKEAEWALNNYEQYRDENLDVNTEWKPENVPYFNEGETPSEWVERTVPLIEEAMMKMLADVKRVIAVEEYLVSKELGLAGQVDLIVETVAGDIVIIDLKATSSLKHTHKQQIRGYGEIVKVKRDLDVDGYRLVRANTRYSNEEGSCDTQVLRDGMSLEHKQGYDVSWHEDEDIISEVMSMSEKANEFVDNNINEIEKKFEQ